MDTELLRTFLEVNRTRHFARAAQNLFVTQAAVSARMHQLEEVIGARLFTRERNNIQLTPAGHRLLGHAQTIVSTWNRALLDTGADNQDQLLVVLGCLPSLSEIYLNDWLAAACNDMTETLLQVELLDSAALVPRIREQSVSLGLLYEPPQSSDLVVVQVTTVDLILVSTAGDLSPTSAVPGYVHIDWGNSFALARQSNWPVAVSPVLRVDSPSLAREFIIRCGGSACLPRPMVEQDLADSRLHPVRDTPAFERSVFLARSAAMPLNEAINAVIERLMTLG